MATPTQTPVQPRFNFETKPKEEKLTFLISSFVLSTENRQAVISEWIEKHDLKELCDLMDELVEHFEVDETTKRKSVMTKAAKALHIKTKTVWDIIESVCQCFLALLMKEDQRSPATVQKISDSLKKLVEKSKAETDPELYQGYVLALTKMQELFKNGEHISGQKMFAAKVAVAWQKWFTDKEFKSSSIMIVHQVMCLDLAWQMVGLAQENPAAERQAFVALAPPPEKMDLTSDLIFVMINYSSLACHYMLSMDKMSETVNVNWGNQDKMAAFLKEKVDPFKEKVEHLKVTPQKDVMSLFQGLMQAMMVVFISWQVKETPEKLKLLKDNHVYDSCLKPAYTQIKEICPEAWADFSPKAAALKAKIAGFLAQGQIDNATTDLVNETEALAQAWEAWTETTSVDTYYEMLLWQCCTAILLFVIFDVASDLAAKKYEVLGAVGGRLGEHLPTDDGADAEGATGQQ